MPKVPDQSHLRQVALSSITSFVEWVEFDVVLMHDCKLLKILYSFLEDESLKTPACECLLHILSRKVSEKFLTYFSIMQCS